VDVVFGTHNIGSLPALLDRARHNKRARSRSSRASRPSPHAADPPRLRLRGWVSISVGCNNTCTFCIVPSLRGKEQDRRPGEILAEIEALVAQGVIEITLLGQNVNTYGVEFGDRLAFGKLLRACGEIEGLERVRFTSPHPAAFTDDVIEAMAQTPNVMPSLHMPLQSGLGHGAQGDAPLLPQREVPAASSTRSAAHPGCRDHHRHHRRLPG
jgi:tRNA-2-methylthio-N6-dimethylallyladenosine synthase